MTNAAYRYKAVLEAEKPGIDHRRDWVFGRSNLGPRQSLGLALSGGGIRSATFCLGVLQALAMARRLPGTHAPVPRDGVPLLAHFDYLSTVSGGGYTGSFFSSLFRTRPGELRPGGKSPTLDQQAEKAKNAYAALSQDPPGRMGDQEGSQPIDLPLRWLRENGRYLAPNNTGDFVYDAAIAVRNLIAVHYVWGITLLMFFTLELATRFSLASGSVASLQGHARWLEGLLQPEFTGWPIWLSPWFAVLGAVATVFLVPLGVAYWLKLDAKRLEWGAFVAALALLLIGSCLLGAVGFLPIDIAAPARSDDPIRNSLFWRSLFIFLVELSLALVAFVIVVLRCRFDGSPVRTKLTQWTSFVLAASLLLFALAVVETAAQSLYLWLKESPHLAMNLVSLVGTVGVAVTALKQLAPFLAQPAKGSMLSKLPLDTVLAISGFLFLTALLVAWNCAAIALYFNGDLPSQRAGCDLWILCGESSGANTAWLRPPWIMVVVCALAAAVSGLFLGFVNLSSLQTMYSARLTRAYLGASNAKRFSLGAKEKMERVTEPHKEDDFTRAQFYLTNSHYGPAHLINVTVNATTGSGDQLTQRDRQGLPMAVTPAGFVVDGHRQRENFGATELTIGQWVGISGAAFSTGTGRGTSLGRALSFSLANVRLGWWWKCGDSIQYSVNAGRSSRHVADFPFWRNQAYLLRELRGRFLGTDGSHWYLSDGGHFDNTGVYELLGRRLHFIVCCDCGADPQYAFEDLANLMRIARIDFGAEFTLIKPDSVPFLQDHTGNPDHLFASDESEFRGDAGAPSPPGEACALLYRVTYDQAIDALPNQSILLVLKPRLLVSAPLDLFEYRSRNPDFPQQSTGDQFFDEAQWESYRKLGVLIGSRMFPA